MKINIRTSKQQKFDININGNETVARLKELIEQQESIDRNTITLIFAGRFMNDDSLMNEFAINEKECVVLAFKTLKSTQNKTIQTQTSPPPLQTQNTTLSQNLLTSNDVEQDSDEIISSFTGMGFQKDEVIRARNLAGNNPSKIFDILTTREDIEDVEILYEKEHDTVFSIVKNLPLFIRMRALIQANLSTTEELIEIIGYLSPQLYQIIKQNLPQFDQLFLNDPVAPDQIQNSIVAGLGLNQ